MDTVSFFTFCVYKLSMGCSQGFCSCIRPLLRALPFPCRLSPDCLTLCSFSQMPQNLHENRFLCPLLFLSLALVEAYTTYNTNYTDPFPDVHARCATLVREHHAERLISVVYPASLASNLPSRPLVASEKYSGLPLREMASYPSPRSRFTGKYIYVRFPYVAAV